MADFIKGEFESCTLRYAWGMAPSDATIVFPGGVAPVGIKDPVKVTVDGAVWFGTVSAEPVVTNFTAGQKVTVSCVDYRSKLMDDTVFGVFNRATVIEDDPLTPGIDRKRKYEHIYPNDWATQNITRSDKPLTAREIIEAILLNGPSLKVDWHFTYHAAMEVEGLPLEVDAANGKKFGNVLSEICTELGLSFYIVSTSHDDHRIVFGRRGEGDAPVIAGAERPEWSDGETRSWADTQIIIAGDRQLHQIMLDLEPDWRPAWEKYWLEAEWVKRVDTIWGPFEATSEGQARLHARAREVTVKEYVDLCGDYSEDFHDFEDYRTWQDIGRMSMPAYIYLRDIVFKAWRIPLDTTVGGTRLDSLDIHEGGLLADVEHDAGSGVISYREPRAVYPETKAYVVVKGAEIERLFDPRLNKGLTDEQIANARNTWLNNGRFQIDRKAKTLVFENAQILFGEGESGPFLFPNRTRVPAGNPLYDVAVPNALATLQAAQIKACIVVAAGRYAKTFGTGDRTGVQYVSGLCDHILRDASGAIVASHGRIPYFQIGGENKSADDIAKLIADNLLAVPEVYSRGNTRRVGAAGTPLNGVVESVTVELNFSSGITEEIALSRERTAAGFLPRQMLERVVRSGDLFSGQSELRNEARTLRAIADALAKPRKAAMEGAAANAQEVMQRPVGAVNPGIRMVNLAAGTAAGTPVFQRSHNDTQAAGGEVFGGVTTMQGASGPAPVATQGVVPVRVQGPFTAGSTVGVRGTETAARIAPEGHRMVGRVMADYSGTDIVLAPVQLGAGHSELRPAKLEGWMVYVSDIAQSGGVASAVVVKLNPAATLLLSDKLGDVADFSEEFATEYSLEYGHCLWMELTFGSDAAFSTATIKHGVPASNGWTTWTSGTHPRRVWNLEGDYPDDKTQTLWVMLASIDEAKESDPIVAQFASGPATLRQYRPHNLQLTRKCADTPGRETIRWVEPCTRGYEGIL